MRFTILASIPRGLDCDLSAFVEKAVRDQVFRSTVEDIKNGNADTDPDELQALIDETVREVRAERYARRRS